MKDRRGRWWLVVGAALGALVAAVIVSLRRRTDRATIQRCFWYPIYDQLAWLYDGVDWFTGGATHQFRLRALPHLPPPGSGVLEIGFGSGRLHLELAGQYEMAGLDIAPGMVELTRLRLAERGLDSDLRVGSVEALPWSDEQFDAVLLTFAFSAFPDAEDAMDEMVRVLKPGGKLIIVDAGEAADGNLTAHLLAKTWEALGDYMRDEGPLMAARGLDVVREEFGPWGCVHVVVGSKP